MSGDLDARFDALIQGYAEEIGACALRGDMPGMKRAQSFYAALLKVRQHWLDDNPSAVRTTKPSARTAAPQPAFVEEERPSPPAPSHV